MCIQRLFRHGVCTHVITRLFRCAKPTVCEPVCKVEEYHHPCECSDCLDGNMFPISSYTKVREELFQSDAQMVEYADSLLSVLVAWLVARYEAAPHDGRALVSNPHALRRVATVLLQSEHAETGCVECGKRSFDVSDGPFCPCVGMDVPEDTTNPSQQLRVRFVTDNNRLNSFMALLEDGEEERLMRAIKSGWGPVPLPEAVAESLVDQPFPLDTGVIAERMMACQVAVDELAYELQCTPLADDFTARTTLDKYADSSRELLSSWVGTMMVIDTGLPAEHMLQVLRLLAGLMLHPKDGRRPASWQRCFALYYDAYQDVMLGYLSRLDSPVSAIKTLAGDGGFLAELDELTNMHATAMASRMQRREDLVEARVRFHSSISPGRGSQAAAAEAYAVLGLATDATAGMIKKAYYAQAKKSHPDKLAPGQTVDAVEFRRVRSAYEHLQDPRNRACSSSAAAAGRDGSCQVCGVEGRRSDGEFVTLGRCGHTFHTACLVAALVAAPAGTNCCPKCAGPWDSLARDLPQGVVRAASFAGYEGRWR